jgi:hypothetical protein
MSTQILFEFVAKDVNLQKQLKEQKALVKSLNEELMNTEEGTEEYDKLTESLFNAKSAVKDLEIGLKATKRAFELSQVPDDSLAGLRLQYAALVDEITRLSKAERESTEGLLLIAKAEQIKKQINSVQESYGNFTGSVGDYRNKIIEAAQATGFFDAQLREQAGTLGDLSAIFKKAAEPISEVVTKSQEFGIAIKENATLLKNLIVSKVGFSKASRDAAKEQVALSRSLRDSGASSSIAAAGVRLIGAALKAAGIGIILSLIALLIDQLRKFDPVIKFVGRAFAAFGGALQAVGDRVREVIDIFKRFSFSNIAGTVKELAGVFTGLGSEMKNAASAAFDLKQRFDDLEDAQEIFSVSASENEIALQKLNVQLRNRTKSEEELLSIAEEITRIEGEQLEQRRGFAKENIDIVTEQITLGRRLQKEQIEFLKTGSAAAFKFLKDLESQGRVVAADVTKYREAVTARNKIDAEAANASEKIENRVDQIRQKFDQKREQQRERQLKLAEQQREREAKALEAQNARIQKLQEQLLSATQSVPENRFAAQFFAATAERDKAIAELEKQAIELEKQIQERRGKVTEKDKQERDLIASNTEAILRSYQERIDKIAEEEQKLFEDQQNRLNVEYQKILSDTKQYQKRLVEIEIEGAKDQARERRVSIEESFKAEKALLDEALANREIGQREYAKRIKEIEGERIAALLEAERAGQQDITSLLAQQFEARLSVAEAAYRAEVAALTQASKDQRDQAVARAKETGADISQELAKIDADLQNKLNEALLNRNEAEKAAAKERVETERQAAQAIASIEDQAIERRKRQREDEEERIKELAELAIDVAGKTASQIAALDSQRLERRVESELQSATLEADRRKALAGGNAVEIAKIEEDLQKKRKEIERGAARERQNIAIKEAIIQGALAAIKALPNFPLVIATALATALQVAVIKGQKFERGGLVKMDKDLYKVSGPSHSAGGVKGYIGNTAFEIEGDEVLAVVNKRNAGMIQSLSDINAFGGNGRKFQTGGLIAPDSAVRSAVVSQQPAFISIAPQDVEVLAETIGQKAGEGVERGSQAGITEGARQERLQELSIQTSTF